MLGLCPAPHLMWGPLLAVALALPFVRATASRVAPTVIGVVGVLLAFAAGVAVRTGVVAGFAATPRRSGLAVVTDGLRASGTPIREQGLDAARRAPRARHDLVRRRGRARRGRGPRPGGERRRAASYAAAA